MATKYKSDWGGVYDTKDAAKNAGGFIGGLMDGLDEIKQKKAKEAYYEAQRVQGAIEKNEEGIRYMKQGDWHKAGTCWKMAAKDGNEDAKENLKKYAAEIEAGHKLWLAETEKKFKEQKKRIDADKIAAENGDADAMFRLGECYYDGVVIPGEDNDGQYVPKNRNIAFKWFRKAADKGHQEAKQCLKKDFSSNKAKFICAIVFAVIMAIGSAIGEGTNSSFNIIFGFFFGAAFGYFACWFVCKIINKIRAI